jgi:lathosterol oxidase
MLSTYAWNVCACAALYFWSGLALQSVFPSPRQDIRRQVVTSLRSIPAYALLPTACDILLAAGWARDPEGYSVFGVIAHLAVVEFLVYWIHRLLHAPRLYWLHRTHHSFREGLTPYAGLAFHPVDGLLQAVPYVAAMFVTPVPRAVHRLLLFGSGFWSSYIHSAAESPSRFILGPKHHAEHHRSYLCNYGHYTKTMDVLFGTLQEYNH